MSPESVATSSTHLVVDDLSDAAGVPRVPVKSLPPAMTRILGLFSPAVREMTETSYQRDRPFVMDESSARLAFGLQPTPWPDILAGIIEHYRRGH